VHVDTYFPSALPPRPGRPHRDGPHGPSCRAFWKVEAQRRCSHEPLGIFTPWNTLSRLVMREVADMAPQFTVRAATSRSCRTILSGSIWWSATEAMARLVLVSITDAPQQTSRRTDWPRTPVLEKVASTYASTSSADKKMGAGLEVRKNSQISMVPRVGLEPTLSCLNQILSLARLPISPPGRGRLRMVHRRRW
jgi:hypothetical protein